MTPSETLCAAAIAGDLKAIDQLLEEDSTLVGCHGPVHQDHRVFMDREGAANGWTPLHLAAHYGQTACVKRLIEHGADINAIGENPLANTPLHAAVVGRNQETMETLLSHGPDFTLTDASGSTAIELARAGGADEIARMIEKALSTG